MSKDFNAIVAEYGPLLSRVASSYEANQHLQQELLQEISLAVWQSLKAFKGNSSLKTYILRVAHNKAVTHVAYHAKQPFSESYCEIESPHSTNNTSLESQLAEQSKVTLLLKAVRKLPMQSRQIVTMSMEGLGYQEIAEVCGISPVNVGVILNRAKKSLMETINHE
ncbi:sigma-70 family RNA polymerase sigma factor [Aliiglaciecola sp. NS0011-25]|uniref:RNA polymerase sigma factor n=1 Tax=Aliiglaciecola sp. NS0011-25 TaxID=3127654 RepID=UPI003107191B